jgi:hypothetical protein
VIIRKLPLVLALVALLPSASDAQWREPPRTMQPAQQRFTDCRAVDGDTLACRQGRVRLRGVDTPERGESGYRAAQQELRRLNRPGFAGGSNFQIGWSRYEQNNEQILP